MLPREGKELSNTLMCKTFNENVECYKHSQRKRHDMHDIYYKSSAIKQGVVVTNQRHGDYTTFVRQHTDSSGVRVYTSQADVCDSVWSPLHSSGPTNPSHVFVTEGSIMDSADPIGDNTNCSRALHNSNICRQDQPVSGKLEGFILRQLGPTDCDQGIPYSPHCRSSSKVSPSQPTPTIRRCDSLGGGNPFFTAEAGNPTNSFLSRGVLFKHVPGAQERGRSETCNKSQTSEQICEIRAFQDGGVTYSKSSPPEERLDGKNRLKGCLLHDTHGPSMPSPPPFQSRGEVISIQLSPFQPMHGQQSVYQNSQASSGDVEIHGTLGGDIHRRHASHGILQRFPYGSHSFDPVSPREHKIRNQREEVSTRTHSGNRISRNDHQLQGDGHKLTGLKDQRYQARSAETSHPPKPLSPVSITSDRQAKCNHPGTPDGSLLLPGTPDLSKTSSGSGLTRLPITSSIIHPGKGGSSMVGTSLIELEWEKPDLPTVLNEYNFRCLTPRVRSVLQWGTHQRSMVSTRTIPPHQLPGTAGSLTSSENFCQREVRDNNSPENRQHNSCCLHQQDGGNSITYAVTADKRPVAVVYGKKYSLTSSALTRSIELHCRQGVEDLVGQIRMELNPTLFWKIKLLLGPWTLSTDLFASRLSTQLLSSVSWKPDPLAMAVDASKVDWGKIICQSPMELGRHSPISRVGCIRDRSQSSKLSNIATDLVLSS